MFALFSHIPNREHIVLTGQQVLLRPLTVTDAEAMLVFASDPQVTRFLPWTPETNVETVRSFLADQVGRRKRGDALGFAVVSRETGVMIGSTDLMNLRAARGEAELGYLLHRDFWGRGVMTEAAHLTLSYGFEEMGLQRVYAWADQENQGSRRVLEKQGMQAALTEMRLVKGERRPYVCYEILRRDWGS